MDLPANHCGQDRGRRGPDAPNAIRAAVHYACEIAQHPQHHVWSIDEIAWLLDCDRDKSSVASSITDVPPRGCAAHGEGVLSGFTLS